MDELVEVLRDELPVAAGEGVEVPDGDLALVERLRCGGEVGSGLGVPLGLAGLGPRLASGCRGPLGDVRAATRNGRLEVP